MLHESHIADCYSIYRSGMPRRMNTVLAASSFMVNIPLCYPTTPMVHSTVLVMNMRHHCNSEVKVERTPHIYQEKPASQHLMKRTTWGGSSHLQSIANTRKPQAWLYKFVQWHEALYLCSSHHCLYTQLVHSIVS